MIVESGRFVTAGAALSHIDLALWLVTRRQPAARRAHREIPHRRFPAVAVRVCADRSLVHSDPVVQRFESVGARAADARVLAGRGGEAVGASKRTLARRMQSVLGKSPLSYFQSLRVERAVHLLKTSNASVEEVAARVGYADGATLRSLLRRRLEHRHQGDQKNLTP